MKTFKYAILFVTYFSFFYNAQGQKSKQDLVGSMTYTGTRLTYPLVDEWIKEFNKSYPNISFKLITPGGNIDSVDFKIASFTLKDADIKEGETYFVASNYAQLPIANSNNPLLKDWLKNGITEKELKKIYFKEESGTDQKYSKINIYNRGRAVCAAKSFADHYGTTFSNSKGIGVTGDDKTLIESIKKDTNGITYNNLGFIYDLKTRKVIDGITVIPVDINENGKLDPEENFYSNLDVLLAKLESGSVSEVTVDKVNVIYKKNDQDKALATFFNFIQKDGQKFFHQYGFLYPDTDKKIASLEKNKSASIK